MEFKRLGGGLKFMYKMRFPVLKSMFQAACVMKAAFAFVDRVYIHVDEDKKYWFVDMEMKEGTTETANIQQEFENELLTQAVRLHVYNQTHVVRELLLARAMASSFIDQEDPVKRIASVQEDLSDEEFSTIIQDWFEHNEK